MKVYVVIKDNGEAYEAYREWVDKIFVDKDQAEKYIKEEEIEQKKSRKKVKEEELWWEESGWRIERHLVEKGE